MKKLKRRIFSGAAAAAMLLWNLAVLPQDTFPQIEQPALTAKAINVADTPVAPVAKDYPSVTADNYLEYLSQTFKYGYKDTKTSTDFEIGGVFYTMINHEITITADTQVMDKQIKDLYIPRPATKTTSGTRTNPNGQTVTIETFSVVKIDNGSIDTGLFEDNEYLESVFIPATVKDIDLRCFANCKNLKTVTFDNEFVLGPGTPFLKTIPAETFMGCESLESINLEALTDLEALGVRAFNDCKALQSITIPDGVETIWHEAFCNCEGLTSATMDGAKLISTNAFDSCTSLATVSMESVTNIDNSAFIDCTSLAITELPENLQRVGEFAFKNCTALAVKKLPASLKTIEHDSFMYSGITGDKDGVLTLPDEVEGVSSNSFAGCPNLKALKIADSNPNYATLDGNLYRKIINSETGEVTGGYLYTVPAGKKSTLSSLGDKVYTIWESAAEGAQFGNLTLDLDSLNYMAIWAFKNAKIDKLTITGSADATCQFDSCIFEGAEIGELVIDCSIKMPKDWNQENFRYNTEFKDAKIGTVTITENVTSIPCGLFGYDPKNTYGWETVEEIEAKFPDIDTLYFNADQIEYDYVNPGTFSGVHHAVFGPNVKSIPYGMFKTNWGSSKLESVEIPEGVTMIGSNAFWNCTNLAEIDLPESLESIGSYAFRYTPIKSIYLPGNVNHLGDTFIDMPQLEWVAVPNNFGDDTLCNLFWSKIGFESTDEKISDIAPSDNTVTIYGVKGSAADCYVNGKSGDKSDLHSAGNVEFVAVPDLSVYNPDEVNYTFPDAPHHYGMEDREAAYYYTGEAFTPKLGSLIDYKGEFEHVLTDAEQDDLIMKYADNVNTGFATVTFSTRNPEMGVGIGHAEFGIFSENCEDGHAWGPWLQKSTCGDEIRYCLNCYASEERSNEDAHEWDYSNVVAAKRKDPTCTEPGFYYVRCSNYPTCTKTHRVDVPALGHTWATKNTTDPETGEVSLVYDYKTVEANFEHDGYNYRYCSVCGEHDSEHFNVVPQYDKTPQNVEITEITPTSVVVSWDPLNADGVEVQVDETTGTRFGIRGTENGENTIEITGLKMGTDYTLTLRSYYIQSATLELMQSDEPTYISFMTTAPGITDLGVAVAEDGNDCIYDNGVKLTWKMPEGVDKAMIYATKKIGATFETLASLNDFVNNSPSNVIKLDGDQVAMTVEGTAGEAAAADIAGLTPGTDYRFYVVPVIPASNQYTATSLARLTPTAYIDVTTKSVEITGAKITGVKPISFDMRWVNPVDYTTEVYILQDVAQDLDVRELWAEGLESIDEEGRPSLYSDYLESNGYEDDTPDEREAFLKLFSEQMNEKVAEHPEMESMADAAIGMMRKLLDHEEHRPTVTFHANDAVTVSDLVPDTRYTVIIAPLSSGEPLSPSNWLQMQVTTPEDFAKVTNLKVTDGSENSVTVTWDPVDGAPDDIMIELLEGLPETEYLEGVTQDKLPEWDNTTMRELSTEVNLRNATGWEFVGVTLKPDTLYTVLVIAINDADDECQRYTMTQFTLQDPSKYEITNLKALVSNDKKSVDITSTVPLGAAGAAYFLFRKADLEGVELNTFEDIKGLCDGGLDLFRDMTADGKMTIAVDSYDAKEFTLVALAAVDGNEPPLTAILTSMDISLNELPVISNLKVTDFTSDSVKATWELEVGMPNDVGIMLLAGFPELEYLEGVTFDMLPEWDDNTVKVIKNIGGLKNVTSYEFTGLSLEPDTLYSVMLIAVDSDSENNRYTLTQFRTPPVPDLSAVRNLKLTDVTSDSVKVTWDMSVEMQDQVEIDLMAGFPETEYLEGVTLAELPEYDKSALTEVAYEEHVPHDATGWDFTAITLEPDTLYTVAVAVMRGEESRITLTQFRTLPEDGMPYVPNLKVTDVTSDSVKVTWGTIAGTPDDVCIQLCAGFSESEYLEGVPEDTIVPLDQNVTVIKDEWNLANATSYEFTGLSLEPDTLYSVLITAINNKTSGNPNDDRYTLIQFTLPSATELSVVRSLRVTDLTGDSVKVTWDPVEGNPAGMSIHLMDDYPKSEYLEGIPYSEVKWDGASPSLFEHNEVPVDATSWEFTNLSLKPDTLYTVLMTVGGGTEATDRWTVTQFTTPAAAAITDLTATVSDDNTAVNVSCKLPEGVGGALIAVFPTSALKVVETLDYDALVQLQMDNLPMLSGTTGDGTLTLQGLTDKFGTELTVAAVATSDPKSFPKGDTLAVCIDIELTPVTPDLVVENLTAQVSEDGTKINVTCDVPAEAAGAQIYLFSAADVSGKADVTYADIKALVDAGAGFKSELTSNGKISFDVPADMGEDLTVVAFARTEMKNPLPEDAKAVTRNVTVTKPAETTVATTAETKTTTAETKTTTAETKTTTAETKTTTAETKTSTAAETKATTAAETKTTTAETKTTTAAETTATTAAETKTTTAAETKTTTAAQTKTTTAETKATTAAETKTTTAAQTKTTTAATKTTTAETKTTTASTSAQTQAATTGTTGTTETTVTTADTAYTDVTTTQDTAFTHVTTTVTTQATTVTTAQTTGTNASTTAATEATAAQTTAATSSTTTVTTAATETAQTTAATASTTVTTAATEATTAAETTGTVSTTVASAAQTTAAATTETTKATAAQTTVIATTVTTETTEATTVQTTETVSTTVTDATEPVSTDATEATEATKPVSTDATEAATEATKPVSTDATEAATEATEATEPVSTDATEAATEAVTEATEAPSTDATEAATETAPAESETAPAETEPTETKTRALGDVNGDGIVNASDAAQVLIAAAKIGAGKPSDLSDEQFTAADVNFDGIVNASDAAIILQFAAYAGAVNPDLTMEAYLEMRKNGEIS